MKGTIKPFTITSALAKRQKMWSSSVLFLPVDWLPARLWVGTDLGIVSLLRMPQTKGLYNFMDPGIWERSRLGKEWKTTKY